MKEISLTRDKVALVDDEDYKYLNQFKWYPSKTKYTTYATKRQKINGEWITIRMHRDIMNAPKGIQVDHKDRNGLNNQRYNLRECTNSQNQMNKKSSGTSKYLGVNWHITKRRYLRKKTGDYVTYINSGWISHIKVEDKYKHLGRFKTELEAAIIYNIAARKYHREFARPNKFS